VDQQTAGYICRHGGKSSWQPSRTRVDPALVSMTCARRCANHGFDTLHTAEVAELCTACAIAHVSAHIYRPKYSRSHFLAQLMLGIPAADLGRSLTMISHGL
jgi:hypothetical protein